MAAKYVARDAPPWDTWVRSGDPGGSIGIESPFTFDGQKRILCHPLIPQIETFRQCITWPWANLPELAAGIRTWISQKWSMKHYMKSFTRSNKRGLWPCWLGLLSAASNTASEGQKVATSRSCTRLASSHHGRRHCTMLRTPPTSLHRYLPPECWSFSTESVWF